MAAPYVDPFKDASVTPERIDMGVDYSGSGPIEAIGKGTITESDQSWIGAAGAPYPGTFITEKLTRGPLAGRYIYTAEDITPSVAAGDKVNPGDTLGEFTGGSQIETGYAVGPSHPGETMAAYKGQVTPAGGNETAYGAAYSRVLKSVGAPPGRANGPITGKIPKLWPQPPANANAQTTSFFSIPSDIGTFFGDLTSADFWERAGLVIFGALLIIIGLVVLALPTATKVAGEVGSTSRAINAATSLGGRNSGGPTEEETANRQRRLDLAERNVAIGEAKVENVRKREERLSLGSKPKHKGGVEPNPNPPHS